MIFFAAQQHAGKHIVDLTAVGVRQANHHLGEKVRIEIKVNVLLPVFRRVEQLGAAALFELQVKKNDIRRFEIIAGKFQEDIVGLLKRFILGQAVIQIHFHDCTLFKLNGHVLQQRAKEVKQSLNHPLPERAF